MLEKSWSGRLATFWEFFVRKLNFWSRSMRSNLDINLFPGKVKYKLSDELFKVHLYRLFRGWNWENLTAKILRKSEKREKNWFLVNLIKNSRLNQKIGSFQIPGCDSEGFFRSERRWGLRLLPLGCDRQLHTNRRPRGASPSHGLGLGGAPRDEKVNSRMRWRRVFSFFLSARFTAKTSPSAPRAHVACT